MHGLVMFSRFPCTLNTGSHEQNYHSQSDCLRDNCDIAHIETYQESPDPSFAVRETGSDLRWGWLGLACETRDLTVITYVLGTWDDPVNEEIPNSTQANFKGLPGTDGLTSPLKDTKENLLLNF